MTVQKWIVRVHKWVALIVGLQIVLWIAGGVVMSVIPIEVVRGEHKIRQHGVEPFVVDKLLPLAAAVRAVDARAIKSAALGEMLGAPVWRSTTQDGDHVVVHARSGALLSPVVESSARQIAERDYKGDGALIAIALIETPPAEYNKAGPVWRAQFNDRDKTTLYVDPMTGEVTARRSETWRFYDFFWKLHIMDYDDGADFNHPLLVTAAGTAIFVAISGFILLIIKVRRSLLLVTSSRRKQASAQT